MQRKKYVQHGLKGCRHKWRKKPKMGEAGAPRPFLGMVSWQLPFPPHVCYHVKFARSASKECKPKSVDHWSPSHFGGGRIADPLSFYIGLWRLCVTLNLVVLIQTIRAL